MDPNQIKVGAAIFHNLGKMHATVPQETFIFSAEVYAISMAMEKAIKIDNATVVIMSDSYGVLQALANIRTRYSVVRTIIHKVTDMKSEDQVVEFC